MISIGSARISVGDMDAVAIDYTCQLDADELLVEPVSVNPTSPDMSVGISIVNPEPITILGNLVSTGKAVQFSVDATFALRNVDYVFQVAVSTTKRGPLNRQLRLRAK